MRRIVKVTQHELELCNWFVSPLIIDSLRLALTWSRHNLADNGAEGREGI